MTRSGIAAALAAALAVMALCLALPTETAVPYDHEPPGVLRYAREGPLETDPLKAMDPQGWDILAMIYEGLTRPDSELVPRPSLAQAWEPCPQGHYWDFTLREGVLFHDGTPLTASQVVESYLAFLRPPFVPHRLLNLLPLRGVSEYLDQAFWVAQRLSAADNPDGVLVDQLQTAYSRLLETQPVEEIDALTVRFHLETPYAGFPSLSTALPILGPAPEGNLPPGTGPFQLGQIQETPGVVLKSNPGYWGPPPHLERILVSATDDAHQALEEALSGRAHLARISSQGADSILDSPEHKLHAWITGDLGVAGLNTSRNQLGPAVRQALDLALDTGDLSERIFHGMAAGVSGDFDQYRAAEILEMEGWPISSPGRRLRQGEELQLEIAFLDRWPYREAASYAAWCWEEISIATRPLPFPTVGQLWDHLSGGKYHVVFFTLPAWADPSMPAYGLAGPGSPFNPAGFSSPRLEALLLEGLPGEGTGRDIQVRAELLEELRAALPALFLYREPVLFSAHQSLLGLIPHPLGSWGAFLEASSLRLHQP